MFQGKAHTLITVIAPNYLSHGIYQIEFVTQNR